MLPKVLRITVLASVLLLCASLSTNAETEIPKDLSITLVRTMCFGWCPAYTLAMTADGSVTFTPTGAFAHRGDGPTPRLPLRAKITTDQLSTLLSKFKQINFFSLTRRYGVAEIHSRAQCPEYWSDNPSVSIEIFLNGRRKTVGHYLGCRGTKTLGDLVELENAIDKVADTEQWTSQFGWGGGSVVDLLLSSDKLDSAGAGKQITVTTIAVDPENDVLTYNYAVNVGKILGVGAKVTWDLTGASAGTYAITAGVDDGCGICGTTVTKTVIIR